jgi:hypothetical protein
MVESRGGSGLSDEALPGFRIALSTQHFQSDPTLERLLLGDVDRAHASLTQLALDLVSLSDERSDESTAG